MYKLLFIFALWFGALSVYSAVNKVAVGEFSQRNLSGWHEKIFSGETNYQLSDRDLNNNESTYLRANANATASALLKKVQIDLDNTPFLNWSWRIDKAITSVDEQTKQGDDYAARIYVIVKRGIAPWKANALNYVWSSNPQPPDFWPNAYTEKAVMIPLRNQHDSTEWKVEKVNVKQDFQKYFGLNVDHIDAVAIMTDTDNSQLHAIASYGDIYFSAN